MVQRQVRSLMVLRLQRVLAAVSLRAMLVRMVSQVHQPLSRTRVTHRTIHSLDTSLSSVFGTAVGLRRSGRLSAPTNATIGLGTQLVPLAAQSRPMSRQSATRSALAARLVR